MAWLMLLPGLGLMAGILTTVAGLGGGMALILTLSLFMEPAHALAITAPALFCGNLHRTITYRQHVNVHLVKPILLGAFPGAMMGGFVAAALPAWALRTVLVVVMGLALARVGGWLKITPPRYMLVPAGVGMGWLSAMGSGAGVLVGPVLLGLGLTGEAYVSSAAAVGVTIHSGRLLAYGAGGLFTQELALQGALLAFFILMGNLLGDLARKHITAELSRRVEVGTMMVCVTLAVAGITR